MVKTSYCFEKQLDIVKPTDPHIIFTLVIGTVMPTTMRSQSILD